jgi:signal transduction histidine kinase
MAKPTPDNVKEVYECIVDCILHARPFDDLQPHIAINFMGYGTALHEKVFHPDDLRDLFNKQNKELENVTVEINRSGIIYERFFAEGKACTIVEEFDLKFIDLNHAIHVRMSSVFELVSNTWICYQFHASTPDSNIDASESFPMEGLMKKNRELEELIAARTEELRLSLENLKNSQSQLIQSEKMASLGELTAGIAHEIQNPLNFVNNFSEVNKELLQELNQEIEKGNLEEVKAIAKDVINNEQKINLHGKRADGIVKSMLQHSRSSSGQKELTDMNALCDEYLRLSYHGLRAKDKSFNAKFNTDFDSSIPKINLVPQEIGRVILNLINNAFYAVNEKHKACQAEPVEADRTYEPLVVVSTKNLGVKIEISVKDNGNGIPDNIKEKIFQPFFTTKPTGQGTGLGLSLSYDIVKAHGGEIKIESQDGVGTEFIISLPS